MADYTENYNLKKPVDADFFDVEDFNGNADIIDAALNNKLNKDFSNVSSGAIPVSNGGTGATTAADALSNLGVTTALDNKLNKDFSNVSSGALPIANGGTGATTAAEALSNLGALPLSGGTLTGDLRLKPTGSNYGSKINFGDGDYVYVKENTDDNLEIRADNINIATTSGYNKLTISTISNPTSSQKKAIFTSNGYIDPYLIKNYGLLGDNGWVRNQNVLSYVDSVPSPQCGFFGCENCTNVPDSSKNWWFMSLTINNGQKTLWAHNVNTSNLVHEVWINQRWYINSVNVWCGWQKIAFS